MGLLEGIVVVYLRALYYPLGFRFPLQPIPENVLLLEMLREGCTIVMLAAIAAAAARKPLLWFSYFLFTFGLWDIFYYGGLKMLLGWPPSLLTWDILFLMPITWIGPVLAPVIVAFTMIGFGLLLAALHHTYGRVKIGARAWGLMGLGAFVIFATFAWDLVALGHNREFQAAVAEYVPQHYRWPLFALGEGLILAGMALVYRKTRSTF
jgi:hypothetical protein